MGVKSISSASLAPPRYAKSVVLDATSETMEKGADNSILSERWETSIIDDQRGWLSEAAALASGSHPTKSASGLRSFRIIFPERRSVVLRKAI